MMEHTQIVDRLVYYLVEGTHHTRSGRLYSDLFNTLMFGGSIVNDATYDHVCALISVAKNRAKLGDYFNTKLSLHHAALCMGLIR